MKVSVLGTGSFASAIAQILTDNNNDVLLWTNDLKQIDEINTRNTNQQYYDNFKFSNKVSATSNLNELLEYSELIIIALPSKIISDVTKKINKILKQTKSKKVFLNMSKGIDYKNLTTISEIIENNIDNIYIKKTYTMTGPTFAKEIIERKISKFSLAGKDLDDATLIKSLFENEYILIDVTNDIKGIEIISSIKNIVALASGILDGLGYQNNTHALIITEGIKEMMKLALFYNIDTNTILSVSGIGDLVLTASSTTSRNYITGKKVGEGQKIDTAIETTKTVVEGVECAKAMYKLSKKHKIELPITNAIYNIFFKNKEPKKEILKIFK